MAKAFFEVFPGLKLEGKRKDLFAQTQVERVTATRAKDFVRVYLESSRLILKEDVFAVEKEIQKQLFPGVNITVRLYERFHLSSQFSRETLLEVYRDSILLELSRYSHLLYNMFKNAEISFPQEDRMHLLIEDTVLARSKCEELGRILEKIFGERCGLPLIVYFDYREAKAGRFREEDEILISRRVAEIAARYRGSGGHQPAFGEAAGAGASNVLPFPGNEKRAETAAQSAQAGRTSVEGMSAAPGGLPESPMADTAYEAYLAGMAQDAAAAGMDGMAAAVFENGAQNAGASSAGGGNTGREGVSGGQRGTGSAKGDFTKSGFGESREGRFAGKRSGGFSRRRGGGDGDFYRSPKRSDNPDVISEIQKTP